MQNNNYDNQYSLITGENDNVSSSSDLKDFFILVFGLVVLVLLFLISFEYIANFMIDRLSAEKLTKIESMFNIVVPKPKNEKYNEQINYLYKIQKKIIQLDPKIQHRQSLPIGVDNKKEINAYIFPNGTIFFTSGLFEKKMSEQELAFVLAHEMGHYSNRDNLKSISKSLAVISILTLIGNNTQASKFIENVANINNIKYSKDQETKADLYAGEMLFKIYGTNQGGIDAMKKIQEQEKFPEIAQYISDHPVTSKRIQLLEKQQKKLLQQ